MGIDARMFIKKPVPFLTQEQVLQLGWKLAGAFYRKHFWFNDEKSNALQIVDSMYQDSNDTPELTALSTEQFIEIHLSGRYYGKGYERGSLHTYVAIAQFLEYHLPDATIMYGGDSSGIEFDIFDKKHRDRLLEHFYDVGHKPYVAAFDSSNKQPICPRCKQPMIANSWGGDMTGHFCYGCDKKAITWPPNNSQFYSNTDDNSFSIMDKIRKERAANNS